VGVFNQSESEVSLELDVEESSESDELLDSDNRLAAPEAVVLLLFFGFFGIPSFSLTSSKRFSNSSFFFWVF